MKKINGAVLKYIAIISMLIDHSAVMLYGYVNFITENYSLMRNIGRLAFPIFAFLLVEGFYNTSSRNKYLKNLLIFALVSEIPYNYMMGSEIFYLPSQSIYVTLIISFVAMMFMEETNNVFMQFLIIGTACFAGYLIKGDYKYRGVFSILMFYMAYKEKNKLIKFGIYELAYFYEFYSIVHISNVLITFFYNGERGKQNKYFFYWFYPVHLIVLALIKNILIG